MLAYLVLFPHTYFNLFSCKKVKVKCNLVQALRLCTGRMAHRGSRGIALLFHDHSTRRGWGVSVTPRPLFTPGKDPVPIVQKAGWAPGLVWAGAENLTPTGFDPWTIQPIASRYTDWATQPTLLLYLYTNFWHNIPHFLLPSPTEDYKPFLHTELSPDLLQCCAIKNSFI
jgi:hypothetical protein